MSVGKGETQCAAITKAGSQCKNSAIAGLDYCHIHQPVPIAESTIGAAEVKQQDAPSPNGGSPVDGVAEQTITDEELREQLMVELDELIRRVKALSPEYEPPEFTPKRMVEVMEEQSQRLPPVFSLPILKRLRSSINKDLLDAETWKGMWYMVNYTLEYQSDIVRRRFQGDYETDEWGLDWEYLEAVRPFLDFMYKVYWRVACTGIENVPDYDRAILVSNHSGQVPWDGVMVMTAILNEHPAQRLVRNLYEDWFPMLPFISSSLVKIGQALDSVENGTRLLEQDELVGVYPEGYKGMGKLYRDRYKLARFDKGEFVKMALKTQSPIVPVSVVGAEETYISLARSSTLAKLTGLPYFPISPRFPWLGLLGAIPWPTKWYIDFGEPVSLAEYGPEAAEDNVVLSRLTDNVRNIVQGMVNKRLTQRRSVLG